MRGAVPGARGRPQDAASGIQGPGGRRGLRWIVGTLALAGAIVAAILVARWWLPGPRALAQRDPILLVGILNHTREAVFDETLSQALAVQLGQSPFLNIVADDPVRETLLLMGRPPDVRPTGEVAREVCQRLNLKAMVGGSIARLGSLYVVLVEATDCASGESLAREQGQAPTQEQVLAAVGDVAATLRSRLGESLRSVRRFDVPIARATTPSLEALRRTRWGSRSGARARRSSRSRSSSARSRWTLASLPPRRLCRPSTATSAKAQRASTTLAEPTRTGSVSASASGSSSATSITTASREITGRPPTRCGCGGDVPQRLPSGQRARASLQPSR